MTINLSKEAIFPITHDKNNNKLKQKPNTEFNISGCLQGEGKLIGVPCLFIRTSACNLRCIFESNGFIEPCDTDYTSWNNANHKWNISDIISVIKHNIGNAKHIVISGGEPLIQAKSLTFLCKEIKRNFEDIHITIETNGTIFNDKLIEYVDLFSISPKLSNSNPTSKKLEIYNKKNNTDYKTKLDHNKIRYNIEALQKYILNSFENVGYNVGYVSVYDIQFKFVVSDHNDISEIKENYIDKLEYLEQSDILLMAVGMTKEHLLKSKMFVLEQCIINGWRYTDRLHVELFGNKIGV
jgi:7-carboxy-7-deazaguanine synthase